MINKLVTNIIIGKPIVEDFELFAFNKEDWENKEKYETIWIEERYLPNILVTEIPIKHIDTDGVMKEDTINLEFFKSKNLLRKNRPDLIRTLNSLDFIPIKVGNKRVWILVGE